MNALGLASTSALLAVPFWGMAVKSTVAVALAALACNLLARQSAAMRHRVWVLGLAASLNLPMAVMLVPQFTLPVLPAVFAPSRQAVIEGSSASSRADDVRSFRPRFAGEIAENGDAFPTGLEARAGAFTSARSSLQSPDELSQARRLGIEQVFALAWLLGMIIGLTMFLVSRVRQSIALGRLRRFDDDEWLSSVDVAARAIGLDRPIVTLESTSACVPAVVGILRPRLIVPLNWRTWSQAQRGCVLLHELAHVKRRDVLTQLLGQLALIVHWFNPLVWHAVRQLRVERELASDDCVLRTGQPASDYAEQLVQTLRSCRAARPAMGVGMAQSARLDQRVLAILDLTRQRAPFDSRSQIIMTCVVGLMVGALSGVTLTTSVAVANPPADSPVAAAAAAPEEIWKGSCVIEYPGSLPDSVAFSADGKTLLTGDAAGEVMALIFADHEPRFTWKSKVGGSHAAVAFSADQKQVYATTKDGVRVLEAKLGKEVARIDAPDSNPVSIGVFPNRMIADDFTREQIVFGTPRGYFVESWAKGKLADTLGTIETSTVAKGAKPADEAAVPLAVDPKGRSAIMTGPIDATGEVSGAKGKNVLWAYVCGNYEEGSPGNRVMPGHTATVVSAAWSKEGSTAITGDAAGRVIVWDAKTMKEVRRLELGGRVAALAISDDGKRTAAYVIRKQADVYVWETAKPLDDAKPIHTELGDFSGPQVYASLSFSPDGKQLAGCAIDRIWLNRLGELIGKVRVWELTPAPKAQPAPLHSYIRTLPKGSPGNFVVPNNGSLLAPSSKPGAIEFRRVADGDTQARIGLGTFSIRGVRLSSDRRWFALEQIASAKDQTAGAAVDVGVYEDVLRHKATIPSCHRLLDIASGGKTVAVVREQQIELWDTVATKKLKAAPFPHKQITAASFSPDGRLFAVADRQELVLWKWEEDTHERIDLGRDIRSLAFSPNGKLLAVGPSEHESIQIVDLETRQVVRTLAHRTRQLMEVPRMAWSQGGRVLIACALPMRRAPASDESRNAANRLNFWDTADGSIAHQLVLPGSPRNFDLSPNERYLMATLEDGGDIKLAGWRLDGENPGKPAEPMPPASSD